MKPQPTPDPESGFRYVPEGTQMQAAIALGREARKRAQEALFPQADPAAPEPHLLIEGICSGPFIRAAMPNGEVWLYSHGLDAEGRTLLMHIDRSAPGFCRLFKPTAEGVHPFVCTALRVGVERQAA